MVFVVDKTLLRAANMSFVVEEVPLVVEKVLSEVLETKQAASAERFDGTDARIQPQGVREAGG